MSEKHLTELAWKTLAIKKQVKDTELTRALAAYGKTDDKNAGERVKSLDKILTTVKTVKFAHKDDKEVVAYLDEIVKEANKTRVIASAALKPGAGAGKTADAAGNGAKAPEAEAEKEEDDEEAQDAEAEEYRKNFRGSLTNAMSQVVGRAPEPGEAPKPQMKFVALVGTKGSAVLVSSSGSGAGRKVLKALAGEEGGTFVSGECIYENKAHTFVAKTIPPGLAGKLSRALRAQTGVGYKVRVRTPDNSVVQDDDTAADPGADGAVPPTPRPAADAEGFKTRLAALVQKLREAGAGSVQAEQAKLLASEAATFARKGDFTQASALLAQAEAVSGPGTGGAPRDGEINLAPWVSARATAIANLRTVAQWIVQAADPQAREAIVQIQSVIKQLTERPSTRAQAQELRRYLETDEVIDGVEMAPAETGLNVNIRAPLLEALTLLEPSLPG